MKRYTPLVLVAAVLGCEGQPTDPAFSPDELLVTAAEVVRNEWVPVGPFLIGNPCVPELVQYQGRLHVQRRVTDDGDGGFHFGQHLNWVLDGVGLSTGAKYQVNSTRNTSSNIRPPFPVTFTSVQPIQVIGQGRVPNYVIHVLQHVTVNANGEVTSEKFEFDDKCPGNE